MSRPARYHGWKALIWRRSVAATVYVTRVIPQAGIDLLRQHLDVEVNESDVPLSHEELCRRASVHKALVTLLTDKVDPEVLAAGKGGMKIVANVAVGFDNIDVPAATDAGIMVTNTPGVLTETTADFAWTLLMASARRLVEADKFLRAGKFHGWGIMMLLGEDVYGKTLGIVGFGRIGHAMARRAAGFGMRILYFDPWVEDEEMGRTLGAHKVDLDTLLRESDFVSIHTPLTPETHHLIGAEELRRMKSTAVVVNTSRGPVVDEAALADALRSGEIHAAGIDVYEREPEVHPGLLHLDNVVLAPHIASASNDTRSRMATMAAENVIAALDGKRPPQILNPEVLDR
jgi:glyoxylate reductase